RILLGYLVPLVLMAGVAVAVYWSTQTLQRISDSLDQSRRISEHLQAIHLNLVALQRSTRGYVIFKNDTSRKNYVAARSEYQERLRTVIGQVKDPKQQENLRRLSALVKRVEAEEQQFFDLVDAGQAAKATERFRTGRSINLIAEIDAVAAEMGKREQEIVETRHEEQNNALTQLTSVAVGATALALLLAVAFGLWIAARITRTVGEAIAGMSTSSSEFAATVEEHERTVTQQAAAVNETTTTVEELGASARQTESQAESAAAAAKQALDAAREGTALADQVSRSMAQMKHKVGSVAEQILRLSEQAGQIGGIARVVGELANETNMLALNAAVEAARAGEHGKGFAVVASEVRKLSNQSKQSAERANALVAEIQKATNSAVMVTEEGTRTAEEVAAMTQKTVEAFDAIAAAANSVSENAQRALLNSRQQASALGQVTEAMKSLSAGSRQMSAGTEQTKVGVQKLNSIALDLKAMV
ncbi:MAG: CHASE3 domain-containing protein, partial [Betaproteobacteria bacterium]|nr:CHASE3 domain-containing protein [Betaproteobacteria bacterium]